MLVIATLVDSPWTSMLVFFIVLAGECIFADRLKRATAPDMCWSEA
jgi:hypothetical protein